MDLKNREDRNCFCFFNGKIIPQNEIRISPYDLGMLRGYGVFDVMYARGNKLFLPDAHWERLTNSAKELELNIPVTREEYQKTVTELLEKNGYAESTVRTVLTGGESLDAFTPEKETFCILVKEFEAINPDIYKEGAKIVTLDFGRDLPRAKITNYMRAIRYFRKLGEKAEGILEVLYVSSGKVLEAATSNFFIVKDGVVVTPKEGVLHGITRKLVIELAQKSGLNVEERDIKYDELKEADEAFLAATNKGVVPVVMIDKLKIGNGGAGPTTQKLSLQLQEYMDRYFGK